MNEIAHAEREHSLYSPSAFERWSLCPGSVALTKDMEEVDSPAALRGTWMHEQAECLLTEEPFGEDVRSSEWSTDENWDKIHMAVDAARAIIEECSLFEPPQVYSETKVSFLGDDADVFGTNDLSIYDRSEKTLYVCDYKFGSMLVPAYRCGQLLMYACMNVAMMDYHDRPETIVLVVIQPEAPNLVDRWSLTMDELNTWLEEEGEPAIRKAKTPNAELVPGEKQCRWCPASGVCPAQKAQVDDILDMVDDTAKSGMRTLTHNELANILPELKSIEVFIAAVRKQAIGYMEKGYPITGYKLVRGTTRRKWADEKKVDTWLSRRGIKAADRRVQKLIGIPEAERLLADQLKDNPKLKANFEKLIFKPEGAITLAEESSNKTAVDTGNPLLDDDLTI